MTTHDELRQAAVAAVQALVADRSVSQWVTLDSLGDVREEVDTWDELINADLRTRRPEGG